MDSNISWETYNWSKHDSKHYEDVQRSYAPLIVCDSNEPVDYTKPYHLNRKVGLVKISGSNMWQLPIGSSQQDNESITDTVTRAFYRMFDVNKLEELISNSANIKDDHVFTFSISEKEDDYTANTCANDTITWTEKELNDHIISCIKTGERPRWNKPGKVRTCTDYHVINIQNQYNFEYLNNIVKGYVQEISCFANNDIDELRFKNEIEEVTYDAVKSYFTTMHILAKKQVPTTFTHNLYDENGVNIFNGAKIEVSPILGIFLVLGVLALELSIIYGS